MVQHITFCGAPLTGKTTILTALGQSAGMEPIRRSFGDTENLARLDVRHLDKQAALVAISGNFNHMSSKIVPKILTGACAVVYICSALPTVQRVAVEEKHDREEIDRQRFFWNLYARQAEQVGVSWRDIPWIMVLNKIDIGYRNPLSQDIPESLQTEMISCIATQNYGIARLYEKVTKLLE